MIANGFFSAACYLKDCEKNNGFLMGMYAPAYTANLAFACELYFKQLLGIIQKDNIQGHKLKTLFEEISPEVKKEIKTEYNKKMNNDDEGKNTYKTLSFEDCLDVYNTAFEDWRYTYEGGKTCNTVAEREFFTLVSIVKRIADKKINILRGMNSLKKL